jgi:anti-sigma factor RsiW
MSDDAHARAKSLIEQEAVEGIAPAEREWLERHLETCEPCATLARLTRQAIQNLRSISVALPSDLVSRTQLRVYLRAQELRPHRRASVLWISFALSWGLGIASAPLVWRGFEWVGRLTGLPTVWLKLTFGLWWGVPAAIAAGIWAIEKRRIEEQ